MDQTHLAFYLLIVLGSVVCQYVYRKGVELGAEEMIEELVESGVVDQFTDDDGEVQLTAGIGEDNINWTCGRCGFYGGCTSVEEECEDGDDEEEGG